MAIAIRTTRLALIRAHIDRGGRKARRAGGARVPSWAPACASRQRRPAYRVSHLAGQGRARSSPSPAPTFEVNKWKRLSSPPSVARLISAAHLSSRGTKGAQRRGQLRPSLGGVQGAAAAPSARPPALHPAAWSQVRSARRAHNCGAARTAAGRGRNGRAPPLGDNQRSHLNKPRSASGRRRPAPRAAGRAPSPASQAPLSPRFPGPGWRPPALRCLSPALPARPTQPDPRARPAPGLIGAGDQLPPAMSLLALSAFLITPKHTHTRTHENTASRGAQGRRRKRNRRPGADRDLWVVLILELT